MLKDAQKMNDAIEYMQDGTGIYGLKVNCGRGPFDQDMGLLYVRPDKVVDRMLYQIPSLFHAIPGGKKEKWWGVSTEAQMQESLVPIICAERMVVDPRRHETRNWKNFIMACDTARGMINSRINKLYSELIPEKHLQILRRYPINCRNSMYPELCRGGLRAWQLAVTFPALAWWIIPARRPGGDEMRDHAFDMVLKGALLRDVAAVAGVPMSFRRFPPALCKHVIGEAGSFLRDYPGLVENHCPATVPRMRAWLRAIAIAKGKTGDPAYPLWVAKHGLRLAHFREVPRIVSDIGDFAKAGVANKLVDQIDPEQVRRVFALLNCRNIKARPPENFLQRDSLIPRPFSPDMAPQTVKRLSDQWHEDVSKIEAEKVTFPPAWYQGGTVADVSIEPIQDHVELSAMARRFRNCSATYSRRIAQGDCYLFTASHEGKPVAMIEIAKGNPPRLAQVSGPCNKKPETRIVRAVNKWFKERLKVEGNGKQPPAPQPTQANEYDEMPF
jgi:hypothetical protein